MAKKLSATAADPVGKVRKRKSAADQAADELQALDPTVTVSVKGEEVTVREYGFFQKSRVAHRGKAFIAALQGIVCDGDVEDVWDEIWTLFGDHEDFVRYAIAEAVGKPVSWVCSLADDEIEPLAYLWFGVAGRFFFSLLTLQARGRLLKAQLAGSTSSGPSVGTSSDSGGTPSGS